MGRRSVKSRIVAALAAVLSVGLVITGCSGGGRVDVDVPAQVDGAFPADTQQQLQDAVTFAMKAAGASGAVVGVWAPWSGSWVAGLGTQSATDPTPVTADMDFRVGDVTRAMTCDALYAAAAAGTVHLDDSVTAWVSSVPTLAKVTLLDLCNGTSAVGAYRDRLLGSFLANPDRVWDPRELVAYGLGHSAATAQPGSSYDGSDTGYVLLGLALERATGASAADLLDDDVFSRLGMSGTQLPPSPAATPATTGSALSGHLSLRGADGAMNCTQPLDVTTMSSTVGYTDSGVVSNLSDLHTYVQALATGALLGQGQDRFAHPLAGASNASSWFTATGGAYHAGSLVGQFGSFPGYTTAAFADPDTGLSIVVALNNSGAGEGIGGALAWQLASIASKAAAAAGQTAPEAGLPWTAQQFHDQIAAAAICPIA